jgi:hypothetical protein
MFHLCDDWTLLRRRWGFLEDDMEPLMTSHVVQDLLYGG